MILKISNLPISMFMVSTIFPTPGKPEKFPMELTLLNPGPTLPIVVIEDENAVYKSMSIEVKMAVVVKKTKIYRTKKTMVCRSSCSDMVLLSIFTIIMALG